MHIRIIGFGFAVIQLVIVNHKPAILVNHLAVAFARARGVGGQQHLHRIAAGIDFCHVLPQKPHTAKVEKTEFVAARKVVFQIKVPVFGPVLVFAHGRGLQVGDGIVPVVILPDHNFQARPRIADVHGSVIHRKFNLLVGFLFQALRKGDVGHNHGAAVVHHEAARDNNVLDIAFAVDHQQEIAGHLDARHFEPVVRVMDAGIAARQARLVQNEIVELVHHIHIAQVRLLPVGIAVVDPGAVVIGLVAEFVKLQQQRHRLRQGQHGSLQRRGHRILARRIKQHGLYLRLVYVIIGAQRLVGGNTGREESRSKQDIQQKRGFCHCGGYYFCGGPEASPTPSFGKDF